MSSRLRDITESTEAEARDDTHRARGEGPSSTCRPRPWSQGNLAAGASADCRSVSTESRIPSFPEQNSSIDRHNYQHRGGGLSWTGCDLRHTRPFWYELCRPSWCVVAAAAVTVRRTTHAMWCSAALQTACNAASHAAVTDSHMASARSTWSACRCQRECHQTRVP